MLKLNKYIGALKNRIFF